MELQVQKRNILGRKVKTLRGQGLIPAELYGRGVKNEHLAVSIKEFKKAFKEAGENTVVNVLMDGDKRPVLISGVTHDGLSGEIQSVDFYQVRMDEKLTVGVPLEFIGLAPAVKEQNAVLVKALQELEVEALPADLPKEIRVDLSKLAEIGQSIYVKDLEVPAGVKFLVDDKTVVASAIARVTEEEELAAQQAATGVEAVKVETEEKKAEREAVKTTEQPVAEVKETPKK